MSPECTLMCIEKLFFSIEIFIEIFEKKYMKEFTQENLPFIERNKNLNYRKYLSHFFPPPLSHHLCKSRSFKFFRCSIAA